MNVMKKKINLVVVGSVALDEIETPKARRTAVLGGAATYACAAASFFTRAGMVGVVGSDFPKRERKRLEAFDIDLQGLQCVEGATFRWSGVYEADFIQRRTLDTQLGVFADFAPQLPEAYREAEYLLLGNIMPVLQLDVLKQAKRARFVAVDTMNFWIDKTRDDLMKVIAHSTLLSLNDEEARLLTGKHNLRDCADAMLAMGPRFIVIKKGEHGALLFTKRRIAIIPAYLTRHIADPTGAGDTYAGAFMGCLAAQRSTREQDLIAALHTASVVASFGVEAFGLDRLEAITPRLIAARQRELRAMLHHGLD